MLWDPLNAWPKGRRWLWAALTIIVCLAQGANFLQCLRPARERGADFYRNWIAARYIRDGIPIYSSQEEGIRRYLGYRSDPQTPGVDKLTHPPLAAILALPFVWLDYPDATLAWNAASLCALAVSLWLVGRHLGIPFPPWAVFPLTTLTLLCIPLREHLIHGQLSLILLVLLIGAWALNRSGHPCWAGALVGLATAIKLFPGFVLLYFLVRREWKAFAAGVACLVALTQFTLLVVGPQAFVMYVTDVLPLLSQSRSYWLNSSIIGFWSKLFDPGDGLDSQFVIPLSRNSLIARIGIAFSVGGILVCWARNVWVAHSRDECDRAFGLTFTTMLLVSPVVWDYYFPLLVLPIALIWLAVSESAWGRAWFLVTVLALWTDQSVLWVAAIPGTAPGAWPRGVASPVNTLTVLSFQFYAVLSLFIMQLVMSRQGTTGADAQGAAIPGSAASSSTPSLPLPVPPASPTTPE